MARYLAAASVAWLAGTASAFTLLSAPQATFTSRATKISTNSNSNLLAHRLAPVHAARIETSMAVAAGVRFPFTTGSRVATKKLVVVTGASSGLGKACVKALANKGDYLVVCAVRDPEKMKTVADELGLPPSSYKIMELELASLSSVRQFAKQLKAFAANRSIDSLICNAAVYQPAKLVPNWTEDGFEMQLGVNHMGHFLLVSLLMDTIKKAKDPRVVIVGSITGNTNSIGGGLVWPRADLGTLGGLEKGGVKPVAMIDGKPFNGAKAYKDSKVLNMMTVNELHRRYHKSTGITFTSMYPGCIAETALFREKRQWFRTIFPLFMRYVTGGYVGEDEAGERLAATVADPACKKSGVYWSWNGNAKQVGVLKDGIVVGAGGAGGEMFENEQSDMVKDQARAEKMWELSTQLTGAKWPAAAV
ncbi:hypothetical protein JKP88DRAFT_188417 [Tribonema minus]|uniref:protochlorophyllide reductase n=1 Tax=Tribonema minus TaxID=303371 RepID=A0A835YRH1_9STRA|nr:hypothetical protein JKP88DRAFT_188417 [Tribonema minus]